MFQKMYFYLNENQNKARFFLIYSNSQTVDIVNKLYKEAKSDFNDIEESEVKIGIFKDGIYKDYIYIFFDIAMPNQTILKRYFKVNRFN